LPVSATLTPLNSGKILVAGGFDTNFSALSNAELYDPKTGTFTTTGSLATARATHTATLLNNGKVLVTGGGGQDSAGNFQVPASAELYDPAAGTFASSGNANATRLQHTATLLNNGQVLLAGGIDNSNNTLASVELYDPGAGTFAVTGSLNSGRWDFTATLLTNGTVLVIGGFDSNSNALSAAELYNPTTGIFASTGSLNVARNTQAATRLPSSASATPVPGVRWTPPGSTNRSAFRLKRS
jgi:sugar (pentulose or hexulose) kinase